MLEGRVFRAVCRIEQVNRIITADIREFREQAPQRRLRRHPPPDGAGRHHDPVNAGQCQDMRCKRRKQAPGRLQKLGRPEIAWKYYVNFIARPAYKIPDLGRRVIPHNPPRFVFLILNG